MIIEDFVQRLDCLYIQIWFEILVTNSGHEDLN
jgi:hypothetical protein